VHIINHQGAGLAPWNYSDYQITKGIDGLLYSNNSKLIFYHFHQFQIIAPKKYDRMSLAYQALIPPHDLVYEPYESAITSTINDLRLISPGFSVGFRPYGKLKIQRFAQRFLSQRLKEKIKKYFPVV